MSHIPDHIQAIVYGLCLTSIPFLHSPDVIFTILTSLSSLPPNDTEVQQRQAFFSSFWFMIHLVSLITFSLSQLTICSW